MMLMVHMEQESTDVDISFGRADVYRLQAVFDSEYKCRCCSSNYYIDSPTGTFLRGERFTGGTSGAVGRIISTTTPISYTLVMVLLQQILVTGETITGAHSGATATVQFLKCMV